MFANLTRMQNEYILETYESYSLCAWHLNEQRLMRWNYKSRPIDEKHQEKVGSTKRGIKTWIAHIYLG